jgi:hypothetical protein
MDARANPAELAIGNPQIVGRPVATKVMLRECLTLAVDPADGVKTIESPA